MKIRNISRARAIWLVPTRNFNPTGISLNRVVSRTVERYAFVHHTPLEKLYGPNNDSPNFEGGEFVTPNGNTIEVSLTVHSDGLVADTRSSTEDTERFLTEFATWLSEEFGTVAPERLAIRKLYISEIFFCFDTTPEFFSRQVSALAEEASSIIDNRSIGSFHFSGITLGTDPGLSNSPATFKLEREANVAHSENRFYSAAPFHTSEHVALIEKFEKLF